MAETVASLVREVTAAIEAAETVGRLRTAEARQVAQDAVLTAQGRVDRL